MTIDNIQSWEEITGGYYRYVVTPKFIYEILVTDWINPDSANRKSLLTQAQGCLYRANVYMKKFDQVLNRKMIKNGFVNELLEFAEKDYEDMKNVSLL